MTEGYWIVFSLIEEIKFWIEKNDYIQVKNDWSEFVKLDL